MRRIMSMSIFLACWIAKVGGFVYHTHNDRIPYKTSEKYWYGKYKEKSMRKKKKEEKNRMRTQMTWMDLDDNDRKVLESLRKEIFDTVSSSSKEKKYSFPLVLGFVICMAFTLALLNLKSSEEMSLAKELKHYPIALDSIDRKELLNRPRFSVQSTNAPKSSIEDYDRDWM